MKKGKKLIIVVATALLSVWLLMFGTDYVRCNRIKDPIFAKATVTADDGGSGTYKGIGYNIEIQKHIDAEYGVKTDYIEMRLFGIMVFAVIVD